MNTPDQMTPNQMAPNQITPAMTPQQRTLTERRGLDAYKEFSFGSGSIPSWIYFELTQLLSGFPGLVGYGGRLLVYPPVFKSCGAKPAFGKGITLRRPSQMVLGERVMIDDYASLEVRGDLGAVTLADRCSIGRLSTLVAKDSTIALGAGCNVGSYCRIATETGITFGESVLVGAYAYIGAGNHQHGGEGGGALIEQVMERKGGVRIGSHAWIGAGAMIMDGVSIGAGAIVGAQSLVMSDVPAGAVMVGSPGRVIRGGGV